MEKAYDFKGLLEELIAFNMKDNFDRVMAFMMCMFFVQEEGLQEEKDRDFTDSKLEEINNFFKKHNRNKNKYG